MTKCYCVHCGLNHIQNNENDQRIDKMIEQELIPFDLEKALEGEPVITRDGMPIREIFYSKTLEKKGCQSVMAVSDDEKTFHEKDGTFYPKKIPSDYDLFMAPKPREKRWQNIFLDDKNGCIRVGEIVFFSRVEAIKTGEMMKNYITTIEFEV